MQTRKRARILICDDQEPNVALLSQMLDAAGYENVVGTTDSSQLAALCGESPPDLLLLDLHMPPPDGFEVMRTLGPLLDGPWPPFLVLTADATLEAKLRALAAGARDFLTKPLDRTEVMLRIENLLEARFLHLELRDHNERLERTVARRTRELRESREETIQRLCRAVEYRDTETGGHIERMSRYCALLAERFGLDADAMRIASPMHDVGKIAVPDHVLLKPGKLTAAERQVMERHADIGYELITGSGNELLELAATIAWTHHEKVDGSGYPRGLAGEQIPLEGRIAAVADVFDALTSDRVYRAAFSLEKAVAIMREGHGTQFDAPVLDLFLDSIDDVLEIRARYPGPGEKHRSLEGVGEPDESGG